MSNILVFLAEGFEEIEALTPVDILRRAGFNVDLVSVTNDLKQKGSHNISVICDATLGEIDTSGYDGCILHGGSPGYINLRERKKVKSTVVNMFNSGKLVSAICAAPTVLALFGVLEGKKACCFPGMENQLTGAKVVYDRVVRDGNIITARGAGCAMDFAFAIVEYFSGEEKARELADAIVHGRT